MRLTNQQRRTIRQFQNEATVAELQAAHAREIAELLKQKMEVARAASVAIVRAHVNARGDVHVEYDAERGIIEIVEEGDHGV